MFGGLPIAERRAELKSGLAVVDLASGQVVAALHFATGVEEVFEVKLLPGFRNPLLSDPRPELDGTNPVSLVPPLRTRAARETVVDTNYFCNIDTQGVVPMVSRYWLASLKRKWFGPSAGVSSCRVRRQRLGVVALEDRVVPTSVIDLIPSVLVVDNVVDEDDADYAPGKFSLREAVRLANSMPDANTITFAPTLTVGGPATIVLTTADPAIIDDGRAGLVVSTPMSIRGEGVVTISRAAGSAQFRLVHVTRPC